MLWRALALAAAALLWRGPAAAQAPILLVVPFAAGGPTDIMTRMLAPELAALLGTPIVVKNTIGAAGTLGAAEVARARPDGGTLLSSPIGPIAIQPSYSRNLAYRAQDLLPVCQFSDASLLLLTPEGSGFHSLADVVAQARAAPGTLAYGTSGLGTLPHLGMVAWSRAAGIELLHVPFRGAGEVMLAFQQGIVTLLLDQPGTARQNRLRGIGTFAPARVPEFPDVPTAGEQGYALAFSIWQGLFAPAGLPPALLARFEAACAQALRTPAVIGGFARVQTPLVHRGAAEFAAFVAAERDAFQVLIESNGLRQAD